MLRPAHALLSALLLSSLAAAQNPRDLGFRAWIAPRCQEWSDATLARLLTDAERDGLLRSPADAARFKEVLADVLGKPGAPATVAHAAAPGAGLPPTVAPEQEYNDNMGFADPIGANATVTASLATFADRDVYRMTLVVDSAVTIQVTGQSGTPPLMNLSDADGRHIANSVLTSPSRSVVVSLPVGDYFITVGTSSPQSYTLTTSSTATQIPTLVPGPNAQNDTLVMTGELRTWRLILAQDSQVQIGAQGGANLDLALTFGRAKGGRIFFVDDFATANTDPRLTTNLPAGTYYAFFHEIRFRTGSFTITTATAALAMPGLQCGLPTPGNIVDKGTRDVFRVFLPSPDHVALLTTPSGTVSLTDGIMELLDSDLGELMENDDDVAILHPRLEQPLPAGLYYIVVRGYNAATGSYDATYNCGTAPAWTPLPFTQTTVSVLTHLGAALQITPGTPCPLQFGFADQIGRITVLDGNGKLRFHVENSRFVTTIGPGDPFRGGAATVGSETLYVYVHVLYNNPYTSPMTIEAPLWTSPTGVLQSLGKAGVFHVLIAGRGAALTPLPLAPPLSGNLLLDPTRLILVVDAQPLGSNGRYAWPFSLAGYGGYLQAIAIDLTTVTGVATNLLP